MRFNIQKSARMYNLADSTRRKISTSTYYQYKPKAVKLQGRIPYRQSCCECCQNIVQEASKYMSGIPSDIGDCIDHSLCVYVVHQQDCLLFSQLRPTFAPAWME